MHSNGLNAKRTYIKSFTTRFLNQNNGNESPVDGNTIANRWEIIEKLPPIGDLYFYIARDREIPAFCGMCGDTNVNKNSDFCAHCGFFLKDSRFLIIHGQPEQLNNYSPLMQRNLRHESVISPMLDYHYNGFTFLIAKSIENSSLLEQTDEISLNKILEYAFQLTNALDFLHRHHIYNINLRPEHIYLSEGNPVILNFANAMSTRKSLAVWKATDIKGLGDSFLKLISFAGLNDENIQELFLKAARREYKSISAFKKDLKRVHNQTEQTDPVEIIQPEITVEPQSLRLCVGKSSNIGRVRKLNEDSIASLDITYICESIATPVGLFIVADGMGGHDAGEEASRIAVESMSRSIINSLNNGMKLSAESTRAILEQSLIEANTEIVDAGGKKKSDMGTTVTSALLHQNTAYVLNIGDARTYLFRDKKLKLVTQDHSLVYRLFKNGQIRYQEMREHPFSNQIISALGDPDLMTSLKNQESHSDHRYYFDFELQKEDGLLLCSDGLWQMLPDEAMENVLLSAANPQTAVDRLVDMANANGGDDNISVIYIQTE